MVRGSPCMCIRHTAARAEATAPMAPGSRKARTSLIMTAPDASARAHHRRLDRVDADPSSFARQRFHQRNDAFQLDVLRDRQRAGPRRFAADVNDVGTVGDHPARMVQRLVAVDEEAAVGEGVRRDVEDAHHPRPFKAEAMIAKGEIRQLQRRGARAPDPLEVFSAARPGPLEFFPHALWPSDLGPTPDWRTARPRAR